jgi:hypothetical protein
MKTKIIGILIGMLLIATTVPTVNSLDSKTITKMIPSSGQPLTRADWIQMQELLAADGAVLDYFGYSVALSGDTALIGALGDDNFKGSAYVFTRNGTTWAQQAKLVAADGEASNQFGFSVSLYGDTALIGAPGDDTYVGSAYIFTRTGTTWTQQAKLVAPGGEAFDYFGTSVSLSGDTALIGSSGDDSNKGSAYVFTRTGTTWAQQTKLVASDSATGDQFGNSVSLSGDTALIGAIGDDGAKGAAYVFTRTGTTWTQEAKLIASDGTANNYFGCNVALSEDYAIVGAFFGNSGTGSAYIFKGPTPDLDCSGTLNWTDVKPGGTVSGEFQVANIGDPNSELSWKIDSYPDWGTWSFTPSNGSELTPAMGAITVGVMVVAPPDKKTQFTGEIKVVNTKDNTDFDVISVSLKTPLNQHILGQQPQNFLMMKCISFLEHFFAHMFSWTWLKNIQ